MNIADSCIPTMENDRFIIIRESWVAICDDNHCAAALLNFFVSWHNWKIRNYSRAKREMRIANSHGVEITVEPSLVQHHTIPEIKEGLTNLYSDRAISSAIKLLESKGFVNSFSNPDPRLKFDKTRHYIVIPEQIIKSLESLKPAWLSNRQKCVFDEDISNHRTSENTEERGNFEAETRMVVESAKMQHRGSILASSLLIYKPISIQEEPLPTLSSTNPDPCGERDYFSSDSDLSDQLPSVCDALDHVESTVNPPPIGNPSLASPIDRLSYSPTNPSGSESSAPRRTTEVKQSSNPAGERYDRRQANRDRAKRESIYEQGLKRKRWQDQKDFQKFRDYLNTWAENRRKDPQKNPDGNLYGDGYIQAILSRTATAEDENAKELECWRNWNIEKRAYAPVIEFEPKPKSPYDNPNVTIEGTRKIIEYLRGMGCDVSRWENISQAS